MAFPIAALVALGLGSAALSAAGTGINYGFQKDAQEFAHQENELNRDFQKYMSSTAYQRTVADMKAAGLNPSVMLGGSGQISQFSGSSSNASNPMRGYVSPQMVKLAGLNELINSAKKMDDFGVTSEEAVDLFDKLGIVDSHSAEAVKTALKASVAK